MKLNGFHHLTAICGDPAKNAKFYTSILGQRLIKRTVNFDDPGTWHLYYGDQTGIPGTALTFFPFEGVPQGVHGSGDIIAFSYQIPLGSSAFWKNHLLKNNIPLLKSDSRFGNSPLILRDPDGFFIELHETSTPLPVRPWKESPIPEEYALGGFHSITILVRDPKPTIQVLVELMGARVTSEEKGWIRLHLGEGSSVAIIDLKVDPDALPGRQGAGSVHHVAWRTEDDDSQAIALEELRAAGLGVSNVRDRFYFHSIYYREPAGVLYEIATDPPGFLVDEDEDSLGKTLQLPPMYEKDREQIAAKLTPLGID